MDWKLGYGSLALGISLLASEPLSVELERVEVSQERYIAPTMQTYETVYTGSEVSQKGMELSGARAKSSVYEAAGILPGVQVESVENNGLGIEQSNVRIRGVKSSLGALSVEGIPNYGGNPIGPRDYLYDMENMESLSLYKGAIPGDIGTGVGSRGGAITLHPKWAKEKSGVEFSQGVGSHGYTRSYLRLDSGSLGGSGTRASGSFSYTDAEKWKGEGDLGGRKNGNITFVQPLGEKGSLKLWANHNDQDSHLYRGLSYAQASDLNANARLDYNDQKTGVAATDINYYDYNRGEYQNDDYLAVFDYALSDSLKLSLKPYYSNEDTQVYQGVTSGGGRVQKRTRDIERKGVIGELGGEFLGVKSLLGYHYEESDMNVYTQNYAITGQTLSYRGYGVLATTGATKIHSPYLKLSTQSGNWRYQAGMKYFRFEDSDSEGYVSSTTAPYGLNRASDLDREGKVHDLWVPTLGVAYDISESWQAYASYGKGFIRPYSYMPLMNTYQNNRAAFIAAGVSAKDLFDGYRIEKSDNFDLGIRYRGESFEVAPTLFYGRHQNLLTNISDDRVIVGGKPISYQQNIGKATSYGVELELNAFVSEDWTLFFNPTYTRMTYDEDLSYQGSVMGVKGKQVVDTPEWMFRAGAIYTYGAWELAPALRYLGNRYGDSTHSEKIDSHLLADVRLSYLRPKFYQGSSLKLSLEVNNLFDKKYISVINASDDARNGSATYYVGAPRSVMLSVALGF